MNLKEFTLAVKSQYIDCDDIVLNEDTPFRSIDSYDSLTGMSIVLMIEDDFGKSLPDGIFRSLSTAKELYDYITKE